MSQYTQIQDSKKIVFGWDNPLQSFYLQVHDLTREVDDRIIKWLGVDSKMPGVGVIIEEAKKEGFTISTEMKQLLYEDKRNGR